MNQRWKAQWIWNDEAGDEPNRYVLFRKTFSCGRTVRAASVRITAGHFYQLYVNGTWIGTGPDRSYFEQKYAHTYDVSRRLRRGRNVIAVRVHNLGMDLDNLSERHAEGPAGLLAELDVNGKLAACSDKSWKTIIDPAYATDTPLAAYHRCWKEDFDAGQQIGGWNRVQCDERDWTRAVELCAAERGPWKKVVPKTTPELTRERLRALNVYVTNDGGHGATGYAGYRVYNLLTGTPLREKGDVDITTERHKVQELLFDMGRVVAGYPEIGISACKGGRIDVYYGDSLDLTQWDTLRLGDKPVVWSPFMQRGGRYFRLVITGADHPVSVRSVRWIRTNYPVAYRGAFDVADKRLNSIWRMCHLTAETCGMEHIVDCVGREQVLWMMDFRFQAPQHYYCFGDTALALKCFRQYALLQGPNGHILGYGPSTARQDRLWAGKSKHPVHDWFGFNFYLVIAALEYFQYTQDRRFLRDYLPVLKKCLAYYAKFERDGFTVPGMKNGTPFVEWGYEGYSRNPECKLYSFSQALYYGALSAYASLCEESGDAAQARRVRTKAAALQKRFFRKFIDPRTGYVADRIESGKRRVCRTIHPHMAVLRFFDDVPDKVRERCLEVVERRTCRPCRTGLGTSLAVEALMRHERYEAAVRLISDYWGAIVDASLPQVPEAYDMQQEPGADCRWSPAYSRCHSYASLANVLLMQLVFGVKVRGKRVELSPYFGKLERGRAVVPTIGGDVTIAFKRAKSGYELVVHAPAAVKVALAEKADKKIRLVREAV